MYTTLIILFISALFFMSGKVRSDLVAMCALVLLVLFGILIGLFGQGSSDDDRALCGRRCYLPNGISKDDEQ